MAQIHNLNRLQLIGNVGNEPEFRPYGNDKEFCRFSVATSESWKNKQTGEWDNHTEWHNIVIFNQHLNRIVKEKIGKGTKLFIEGPVKTRKWRKEGEETDRVQTEMSIGQFDGEIKILANGKDRAEAGNQIADEQPANGVLNDDIPF